MSKISEHLYTPDGWIIIKDQYEKDQAITEGTNFMVGNGYMGYRGTFSEDTKDDYVGCIVSDTWDNADGKWEELCTAPNALHTLIQIDGEPFSLNQATSFERLLDLKQAITSRKVQANIADKNITIHEEKFASYSEKHVVAMQIKIMSDQDATLTVHTGIDTDVWSINGNHFSSKEEIVKDDYQAVRMITKSYKDELIVLEKSELPFTEVKQEGLYRTYQCSLKKDVPFIITKYMVVVSSNDVTEPFSKAVEIQKNIINYELFKQDHINEWAKLWDNLDVKVHGNLVDQVGLRFNIYHAIIATPMHKSLPIGARGLSCQAYQGAAFWDQEIFDTPMYLYSWPEVAKNILIYRYNTLKGAKEKAKKHGFEGAFYAWISGKTGEELCPDFFFKDVLTGRDIRNHFNLWQIHISPDIAYTIQKYYKVTKDKEFLIQYGIEMIFEITRFLASRVNYKPRKNRYELNQVQGPDEYHENVDNNAFTNYQAYYTFSAALEYLNESTKEVEQIKQKINLSEEEITLWEDIKDKLYLPKPNNYGVIEQFDGYFTLESIVPAEEVTKRLIDKEEYYGWPNGITVYTQCLKQADVVQLFHLHPHLFDHDIMKKNYDYYEPRTLHFSSLSPSIHSIVASHIGYKKEAYKYFKKSLMIDLLNTNEAVSGGTFIGGIHTAANGASWQMVINGFAGLSYEENHIELDPNIPDEWDGVSFSIYVRGEQIDIDITRTEINLSKNQNSTDLRLKVHNQEYILRDKLSIKEDKL